MDPIQLDQTTHLFADDHLIDDARGTERRVVAGAKLSAPVLTPQMPWEGQRVYVYGTVLHDAAEGVWRMWYMARCDGYPHQLRLLSDVPPGPERLSSGTLPSSPGLSETDAGSSASGFPGLPVGTPADPVRRLDGNAGAGHASVPGCDAAGQPGRRQTHAPSDLVLFATSKDGITWERPRLGLYGFDGSAANNIVFELHSPSVLLDHTAPDPAHRYKMLGCQRGSYRAATSRDGLHWRDPYPVLPHGDTSTLQQDPHTGEYLAFHKIPTEIRGFRRRVVYLSSSADFHGWTEPRLAMVPDEADDAWCTQPEHRTEFYNMTAFPCGHQWLGLVTVFQVQRTIEQPGPGQSPVDGPIHVQLVHSRDGRAWHRCVDRSPIIANGPHPYDAGCILGVASHPVYHDDQVSFYYTAVNTTHGGALPRKRITIARATWQRDRFVALTGNDAVLTTPLVRPRNPELRINVDATGGRVTVAALLPDGTALPGYSEDDCVPIQSDGLAVPVRWRDKDALPVQEALRLRIHLRGARLFGVQATEGDGSR